MAPITYQMLFSLQWNDSVPQVIQTRPPLQTTPHQDTPLCCTLLQSILLANLQLRLHYTQLL